MLCAHPSTRVRSATARQLARIRFGRFSRSGGYLRRGGSVKTLTSVAPMAQIANDAPIVVG